MKNTKRRIIGIMSALAASTVVSLGSVAVTPADICSGGCNKGFRDGEQTGC